MSIGTSFSIFFIRWALVRDGLKWIRACTKTAMYSILINEESAGFFLSERDLRQGDPLSPFLFILAMEGFDSMMRMSIQNTLLKGFKIGSHSGVDMQICHLR